MITQEQIRRLFIYDLKGGILVWRNKKKNKAAGSINARGYLVVHINGKRYYNHRVIFLYIHSYLPSSIDHIDGDKQNNKINNLRPCTTSQNTRNSKINTRNTSGVKGVSWHKNRRKWQAQIMTNGHTKYLGLFKRLKEARDVVRVNRELMHGEFANHGDVK